jgi:undecaprenyl-diphosphooligosaccharide---protein glycotransferase
LNFTRHNREQQDSWFGCGTGERKGKTVQLLSSLSLNNRTTLLVFTCILAVYGLSVYKKEATYHHWLQHESEYVVGPVTAMSSMDAYHWLQMARDLDAGNLGKGRLNPTKGYPDLVEYHDANLLAWLISLGKNFTGGDYYRSGLVLVSVLGSLFVFPLFFYFHRLDFGASAVLGGLIGTFSMAYYQRSWMGYVDTDLLNIFFPLAVACFILPIKNTRSFLGNLWLAVGAGAMMYLFNWWYEQPGIMLVYLFFIAVYLFSGRLDWRQVLGLLLVFTLASGPAYALGSLGSVFVFLGAYFYPSPTGQIIWPDVLFLIQEAQKLEPAEALKRIHGFLPLTFAGLVGLVYLYCRRFRQMILVTPMVLLGLWSLFGPIRFAMYLAPFIGIGGGVLIELLVKKVGGKGRLQPLPTALVSIFLMFVLFFSTIAHTGFNRLPAPQIPASTTRAMLEIKLAVPRHSAMFTWWDMGYPLMEIGQFATYHDGSLHGKLRTTLIAKAMTSSRQEEMVSMLSYLEEKGFDFLNELIVKEDLTAERMKEIVFSHPGEFHGENVHVLYTEDMIKKFGSISTFGTWDFDKQSDHMMWYESWSCFSRVGNVFKCQEGIADLDRGVISDGAIDVPLVAVLFINDGQVASRRDYHPDARYYLQVVMKNKEIFQVQVVEDRLFWSNFNQQYLLGNYDRRYFEEVYNNFPAARVLRMKRADAEELSKNE